MIRCSRCTLESEARRQRDAASTRRRRRPDRIPSGPGRRRLRRLRKNRETNDANTPWLSSPAKCSGCLYAWKPPRAGIRARLETSVSLIKPARIDVKERPPSLGGVISVTGNMRLQWLFPFAAAVFLGNGSYVSLGRVLFRARLCKYSRSFRLIRLSSGSAYNCVVGESEPGAVATGFLILEAL